MAEAKPVPTEWDERIKAFAEATGKSIEEITTLLKSLVGEPSQQALEVLSDKTAVPDTDIKKVLEGLSIPSGILNKNLTLLRGKVSVVSSGTGASMDAFGMLPKLPDDESFIKMLQVGGVLKVESTEVIAAIKAAIADKIGLFKIPTLLSEKMEVFAEKQEEPVGASYIEIQKLLAQKRYGDVFSAMGLDGKFMSEAKKKEFLVKVNATLWKSMGDFHSQLLAWQETWMKGMNPSFMFVLAAGKSTGSELPPNLMTPPDTAPIIAKGEEFINSVNKIFSGLGIPVARALAFDATRILGILKNENLPAQIGLTTKDQMLKELGVNIGSDIVRGEQSLSRYALGVMSLPTVPADAEIQYFSALLQLGQSIPWDKVGIHIGATSPAGIGTL